MPVKTMNAQQKRMHPVFKKMNAEEDSLSVNQRLELVSAQKTVEKLMGPEPIPSLDIELDEIQNELQRKMVEEIQCIVCQQFPYKPKECKSCNKLFCKYCQLQLMRGNSEAMGKYAKGTDFMNKVNADYEDLNTKKQWGYLDEKIDYNMVSAGRDGRGKQKSVSPHRNNAAAKNSARGEPTPEYDICCPNCQARGDFLQEVNKVLQNCIDFCEFPHRCMGPGGKSEIIWATLGELQSHAQFHCPKFGCDICYREEHQHMTRAQLFDHIKCECPDVLIMCQICNREYTRAEFSQHQCIKDFYLEKLRACSDDVIDNLADNLILHKRQREGLGICKKPQCVERHRASGKQNSQAMILQNSEAAAVKCYSCKNVVAGFEDSYSCVYCNESYCPPCLGYCKFYDLDEMEQLLLKSKDA